MAHVDPPTYLNDVTWTHATIDGLNVGGAVGVLADDFAGLCWSMSEPTFSIMDATGRALVITIEEMRTTSDSDNKGHAPVASMIEIVGSDILHAALRSHPLARRQHLPHSSPSIVACVQREHRSDRSADPRAPSSLRIAERNLKSAPSSATPLRSATCRSAAVKSARDADANVNFELTMLAWDSDWHHPEKHRRVVHRSGWTPRQIGAIQGTRSRRFVPVRTEPRRSAWLRFAATKVRLRSSQDPPNALPWLDR